MGYGTFLKHTDLNHSTTVLENGTGNKLGYRDQCNNNIQINEGTNSPHSQMEYVEHEYHSALQTFARNKNIPEEIKLNKIFSKDYNASLRQNWGSVPNIVSAHNLIRKSNLPNCHLH